MYKLEKYKTMASRHTCPGCGERRCFTRYVNERGMYLPDHVGRCDREQKCGYHYSAAKYLADCGQTEKSEIYVPAPRHEEKPLSTFPLGIVYATMKNYDTNTLINYLFQCFGKSVLDECKRYRIGTSKHWNGSAVFWYTDSDDRIRSGKVMAYDGSGHRVKQPFNHVTWVHKLIKDDEFNFSQCLFGEHLIKDDTRPIAVVESEKSALIASICEPQYLWLACGGLANLTAQRCAPLKNRNVILYPDSGAYDKWKERAGQLRESGLTVSLTHKLEAQPAGYDIADVLMQPFKIDN